MPLDTPTRAGVPPFVVLRRLLAKSLGSAVAALGILLVAIAAVLAIGVR